MAWLCPDFWQKLIGGCLLISAVGLLAGCAAVPVAPAAPTQEDGMPKSTAARRTPTEKPAPTQNPPATRPAPTPSPTPQASGVSESILKTVARQDLGRRLGIPAADVQVAAAARMDLPAGSLGCGAADSTPGAAVIPGVEITLRALGQEYVYRSDGARLVPCAPANFPGGAEPIYVASGSSRPAPSPAESARTDLAGRLGIAPDAITIRSVMEAEWPDASLGCARPGQMYAQVVTRGYRIVLQAGGKDYEYHAASGRVVYCTP